MREGLEWGEGLAFSGGHPRTGKVGNDRGSCPRLSRRRNPPYLDETFSWVLESAAKRGREEASNPQGGGATIRRDGSGQGRLWALLLRAPRYG